MVMQIIFLYSHAKISTVQYPHVQIGDDGFTGFNQENISYTLILYIAPNRQWFAIVIIIILVLIY